MDTAQWLKDLPDELLIGNINVPGTHNSAAIQTTRRRWHACQNHSITQQLLAGIRLLDIRLKIQRTSNDFEFYTCHGRIGNNTFQNFLSLLHACQAFLAHHPSEFVIVLLKVDDWSNTGHHKDGESHDQRKALVALATLLARYPTLSEPALPNIKTARGKIVLYNRINNDPKLGIPLQWTQDTAGAAAEANKNRHYEVWVQDRYNDFTLTPHRAKLTRIINAVQHKTTHNVVLNFASGTWFGIFKLSMTPQLQNQQPPAIGWMLFDYPFGPNIHIVKTIIASNF